MKVGYIVKPNKKGQIVIPQEVREQLNIDENSTLNLVLRDKSVFIYQVKSVNTTEEEDENTAYLKVLEKTAGAWAESEDWNDWDKREEERRAKELKSVNEARNEW
jgi:AbrB family looped-hinge helix DNA binding protein